MSTWLCQTVPMPTPPGERPVAPRQPAGVSDAAARRLNQIAELTELPLFCFETDTGAVVWQSDDENLPFCPLSRRMRLRDVTEPEILVNSDGFAYFFLPFADETNDGAYIIGGYCLTAAAVRPKDLVLETVAANWDADRLEALLARLPVCPERLLRKLLRLSMEQLWNQSQIDRLQQENSGLSRQVSTCEEELSLLHELVRNLHVSRGTEELAVLGIKRLHTLIEAAGHAICLESSSEHVQFLVDGCLPFDEAALARLLSRFDHHDWSQPLVKNRLTQTLLGADFPGLHSLIVAPIGDGSTRKGWILSVNATHHREFTPADADRLATIAAILGTHLTNIELFSKHEELLLSFVRSLVSTLDAKDPYTRGHSERVALIARKLGEEMHLPNSDLEDIYLSGLLHDLGKIGVDDRILRKMDHLTAEEFRHIQQHPMIGYQILSQLKSLKQILPGVRSHHEAMNGKGYPDRLKGDEIPLMARIIAVADAYDAMCSDRPYRKGMPVEKLEEIFRRGAGEQWDSRVIDAYFSVRDDVIKLCAEYSPANGNLLTERTTERSSGITVRTFLRH